VCKGVLFSQFKALRQIPAPVKKIFYFIFFIRSIIFFFEEALPAWLLVRKRCCLYRNVSKGNKDSGRSQETKYCAHLCLRECGARACVGKVGVAVHAAGGASQRCVEDFKHTVSYSGGKRETAPYWIVYCNTSDAMSPTVLILIQCV